MRTTAALLLLSAALAAVSVPRPVAGEEAGSVIPLDGTKGGRVFEGIGALSAGASSRLLVDYPEPARGQVLDLLFKPNVGASLHHLKVEIGGDVNSTDGCEPSHMRTRDDENYRRGYEWWLMKEARARNPKIILDALEWGAPGWIGNGTFYSQDNADFISRFLRGAKSVHGLDIAYVGIWNETSFDAGWIKTLRKTLDRDGLQSVRIVAADEVNAWKILDAMAKDPEVAAAVHTVGTHYPKYKSPPAAKACGKPIWSSEDGPWNGTWSGACALAKMFNRNYAEGRMTKTIVWSPVTAYYDNLPLPGSGLMRANAPWSGHYEVQPAVWAVAHTTQFAQPGWVYLDEACRLLPGGGSVVALKAPDGRQWSAIVETMDAKAPQPLAFRIAGGLAPGLVHVWKTGAKEQFVRLPDATPADGAFAIEAEPNCLYSLTTTTGQQKGGAPPPSPAPFPAPYREDFESYAPGALPKYFSDQGGIFETAAGGKGGGTCLRQVVPREGIRWHYHANPPPETFLGSLAWADYEVSVDALVESSGSAVLFGRVGTIPQNKKEPQAYALRADTAGTWELRTAASVLASGKAPFAANTWHALGLSFAGTTVRATLDGATVAEVTDATYARGMAGVGSGWNHARFDNVSIRVAAAPANLALGKPARASSVWDADYGPEKAVDGNPETRWNSGQQPLSEEWLEVDLGTPVRFDAVRFTQFEDRITGYRIQAWDGQAWKDAHSGGAPGKERLDRFPAVTGSKVRLLITGSKASTSIWEFEVFGAAAGRK